VISPREVRNAFHKHYLTEDVRLFRAPGRVNLIGEHTDYNNGFVLPMAIDRWTVVAVGKRDDRHVRVYSNNCSHEAEFDLDRPGPRRRGIWLDYVEGVAQALQRRGANLRGANLLFESDVPVGAGLSSSAALEVSVGLALLSASGVEMDKLDLALAGQEAEHDYVGSQVGIMDQFISAFGKKGHALLIDCRSLERTQIPIDTSRLAGVICDSGVKHSHATGEYNTRRAECERGVELLSEVLPNIRSLRDVTLADFQRFQDRLPEPIKRRCRHVVTECARTVDAARALGEGHLEEMGRLMFESHESLRDDYEVSCPELDVLVEAAKAIESVAGSRMTGGGFGGCTVNLVRRDSLYEFRETISKEYERATHRSVSIYTVEPSEGAQEISWE
jgi:galactokinase